MVDLECPICLDPLKDPRILNCGHSFCKMCLSTLFDQSTKSALACPECKLVTDISKGLDKLPVNWTVMRALQNSQNSLKASTPPAAPAVPNCAAHPVPAILFCKDCVKLLCAQCLGDHAIHFSSLGPVEESVNAYVGLLNGTDSKVSLLLDGYTSDLDQLQQIREKAIVSLLTQHELVDSLVQKGISQIKAKGQKLQDDLREKGLLFEKAASTHFQALEASRASLSETSLKMKSLSSSAVSLGAGSLDWSAAKEAEGVLKEVPASPSIDLIAKHEVPVIQENAMDQLLYALTSAMDAIQLSNIPISEIPHSSASMAASLRPRGFGGTYLCPYGDQCTRTDLNHNAKYRHPHARFQASAALPTAPDESPVPSAKAKESSAQPSSSTFSSGSSSTFFGSSYAAKINRGPKNNASSSLASSHDVPASEKPSEEPVQRPAFGSDRGFSATQSSSAPGCASPLASTSAAPMPSEDPMPSGPNVQLKSSNPSANLVSAPTFNGQSFGRPLAIAPEARSSEAEKRPPNGFGLASLPTLGKVLAWSESTGWKSWEVRKLSKPQYAGAIFQTLDLQPLEAPVLYTHVAAAEQNPNHPSTVFVISTDGKATIWSENRSFALHIEIPPIQSTSCQIFIVDNPETYDDPAFVIIDSMLQKTLQVYSKMGESILSYSFPSPVISISVAKGNLLLGHGDGTITQQGLFGKRTKENWGVHKGTISNLATVLSSPEGLNVDLVVSSALDKTLVATRLDNYRPQWITNLPSNALYVIALPNSKPNTSSSSLSSSSGNAFAQSASRSTSHSGFSSVSSSLSSFSSLSISGDSEPIKLVVIMQDGKASIISSINGAIETSYQAHFATTSAVAVTDRFIITSGGSSDPSMHIWDWKQSRTYAICKHHSASIFKFKVFANGTRLASLSRDGMVCLWSLGNTENPIPSLNYCFTPFTSLPEVFLISEPEE